MHRLSATPHAALGLALAMILPGGGLAAAARADEPPLAERFLEGDGITAGSEALAAHLARNPGDDQARFGLGLLQFLRAVERLGQSLHRHGGLADAGRSARIVPLLRLPVPANPTPAETTYADVRGMIEAFVTDLAAAEKTLAAIRDPDVSLPLRFGFVRLDLDGDGKAGEAEALWRLHAAMTGQPRAEYHGGKYWIPTDAEQRGAAQGLLLRLDRGDVFWLQGYCHLLSAIGECALAHNMESSFGDMAPYFFARPRGRALPAAMFVDSDTWFAGYADLFASVSKPWPVVEPHRMRSALAHLEEVVRLSRETWRVIEAETDDAGEWIPNANQTGTFPDTQVTAEMIAGWKEFLDEAERILAGRRLVPHWRLEKGRGVNLRRVFLEPRPVDVVRWFQGAAAVPYVEEGACSSPDTWWRLQQTFRGNFIGFAIWFN
jgi:hypothetical protein